MEFISLLPTTAISSLSVSNYTGSFIVDENSNVLISESDSNSTYIRNLIDLNAIQSQATITVLTQGMNGDYIDYYQEFLQGCKIVEHSLVDSLINGYKIDGLDGSEVTGNTNIYIFEINRIFKLNYINAIDTYIKYEINYSDIDISSPMILSYNGSTSYISNRQCNNEFEMALNTVVSEVARLQCGILPKINLIGYSRGGLVNLEYATLYPEIIQNVFT